MNKNLKNQLIYITILFLYLGFITIINKNYIISFLYITITLISIFLWKSKDLYELVYVSLLVSAIFEYTIYFPGIENLYIFHLVLVIFTLISLFKLIKDINVLKKLNKKIVIFYITWFIYMCLSILWSYDKKVTLKYIIIYLMMFTFIFDLVLFNINKYRMNKTIKLLVFLFSAVVIIGTIEVLFGHQLPVKHYCDTAKISIEDRNIINARPIVFSFNPNNLAASLAFLSPFCFYMINDSENKFMKVLLTLISCLAYALIIITSSRTGFVGIFLAFVIYFIYNIINIKHIKLKNLIYPITILIAFIFLYKYSTYFMRIPSEPSKPRIKIENKLNQKMTELVNTNNEIGGLSSKSVRLTIAFDVFNGVFKEGHVFGFGAGNTQEYIRLKGNTYGTLSPHSLMVELMGDFGVFFFIAFSSYYLYLLINLLILSKRNKKNMGFSIFTSLLAFIPASFGPSSSTYLFYYWIVIAIAISYIQVYKYES